MSLKKDSCLSYSSEFKLKVIELAENTSNWHAARQFVDEKSVRSWKVYFIID